MKTTRILKIMVFILITQKKGYKLLFNVKKKKQKYFCFGCQKSKCVTNGSCN